MTRALLMAQAKPLRLMIICAPIGSEQSVGALVETLSRLFCTVPDRAAS